MQEALFSLMVRQSRVSQACFNDCVALLMFTDLLLFFCVSENLALTSSDGRTEEHILHCRVSVKISTPHPICAEKEFPCV